ncbi:MAG: monovalent cation/H+ antiporter subunit D family protein, partial [Gammaproteobacteria bacterium]
MLIESALLVPTVGALLIGLAGRYPNLREAITLLTALTLFVIVSKLYLALDAGIVIELELIEVVPGLSLSFAIEPLGILFGLVASFLWIVTSIYSIGYMRSHKEQHQTRFY